MSRYLLHVLIEDEEAVRRRAEGAEVSWHEYENTSTSTSTSTRTGKNMKAEEKRERKRERERERERGTRHFRALLTSGPPRPTQRAQSTQLQFLGPRFDLFYVMPATPESISRGTLLFRVCVRARMHVAVNPGPKRYRTYLQLSAVWSWVWTPVDEKNRFAASLDGN